MGERNSNSERRPERAAAEGGGLWTAVCALHRPEERHGDGTRDSLSCRGLEGFGAGAGKG